MNINLTILLWALPSFITLGVLRRRKLSTKEIFSLLGWRMSPLRYYLVGVALALIIGGLAALTFWLFARDLLLHPAVGTTQAMYAHLTLSPATILFIFVSEAVFSTLGEELFFRGLLGGWLMKQCGFFVGNSIQALLFVLPHLLLILLASPRYWLVLPFDLLAGWALGWLRFRSGSIWPGWLSHTLVNTMSDLLPLLF
ncbi:MAG: CPBP family intramembrane metalloprotease [Ktedonobacteraceae bacterium]|nr:CPBP family intramembrane metalloprotease [Ktedonobacteraceae bacterium]MBV9713073.1 CPBP family intramembrane metalloprotease [Ktedonobacteraceae bacterium]